MHLTVELLRRMPADTMVHGLCAKYHVSGDWLCWTTWPTPLSRDGAIREILACRSSRYHAPRCLRWFCDKLEQVELEPIPNFGDHMTLDDFVSCCTSGGFIDYDGIGHYATSDRMSRGVVCPSDVMKGRIDRSFTHVVWFNK